MVNYHFEFSFLQLKIELNIDFFPPIKYKYNIDVTIFNKY